MGAYYFAAVSAGRDDVETYAQILAQLARGADRAATLEGHGLDESGFDEMETRVLEALEAADDPDGIPAAVARFDAAMRAAPATGSPPPSLEAFAHAFVVAQEGGNVSERLAERGSSLTVLLRGSDHYVPRFAKEPDLLDRFRALISRTGPPKPGA